MEQEKQGRVWKRRAYMKRRRDERLQFVRHKSVIEVINDAYNDSSIVMNIDNCEHVNI